MEIITRAANRFGDLPALLTPGKSISFRELNRQALSIAGLLYSKGLRAGDSVTVVSPNSPELVMLLFGLLKAGMIAAPLNYRFPEHLLCKTVERLSPRLVVSGGRVQSSFFSGFPTATLESILQESSCLKPSETLGAQEEMERPVTIIHTSASSGEAKAALHTFANHWYNALGSNENIPFGPGDCWLLSLPLYHIGGYSLLFRSLISGGALAIGASEEPLDGLLRAFPVTHLSLVPTQLYRLLSGKESVALLQKLKALLLGGGPAPKSVIEESFRYNIPLYLSYGSTEMGSQIATSPAPICALQADSGRLLPYREIMVAEDGELLVKGPCLFKGYLRNGVIQPQSDSEGWFHTSDMGSVDGDGVVRVAGRRDNMFISGGENIHPEEIEGALMMVEGILEALVVPVPDDEYGQRPVAFIKTAEGEQPDDDAVTLKMQKLVGKLKTPLRYFRVSEWNVLPGSQKIDRKLYNMQASEGLI